MNRIAKYLRDKDWWPPVFAALVIGWLLATMLWQIGKDNWW